MQTKITIKQAGQAMTESVIAASFVLVPLFLLIPLIGKYIDLNHTAIQAARYEAWEYTVWYNDLTEAPTNAVDSGGTRLRMPIKNIANLQDETRLRFFSREAHSTDANDRDLIGEGAWNINDANPLWQDHAGNSLLANTTSIDSTVISNDNTPSNTTTSNSNFANPIRIDWKIFDAARSAGGAIAGFISGTRPSSTSLTNPAFFNANRLRGYSHSQMQVPITTQPGIINFGSISGTYAQGTVPNVFNFIFNGRAAVLTDGWNAGGRYQVKRQVGEMAIVRKLASISDRFRGLSGYTNMTRELSPPTPSGDFADIIECGENRGIAWNTNPSSPAPADDNDGSLWTGYVDHEAIHPDRLHSFRTNYTLNTNHIGGGTNNLGHDCPNNNCTFVYNDPTYQYPWADPAVDDRLVAPDDCIN